MSFLHWPINMWLLYLMHWRYHSLALNHWFFGLSRMAQDNARQAPHSSILIEHDPSVIPYWAGDNTLSCNQSPTYWWNPVWWRYNAVSFLQNPHKSHPIARPWGRGMGCLLWGFLWEILDHAISLLHTGEIQCSAIIMRSVFSQILTKDTP